MNDQKIWAQRACGVLPYLSRHAPQLLTVYPPLLGQDHTMAERGHAVGANGEVSGSGRSWNVRASLPKGSTVSPTVCHIQKRSIPRAVCRKSRLPRRPFPHSPSHTHLIQPNVYLLYLIPSIRRRDGNQERQQVFRGRMGAFVHGMMKEVDCVLQCRSLGSHRGIGSG